MARFTSFTSGLSRAGLLIVWPISARFSCGSPGPRRVKPVTCNDLRVGERMRHRGGVRYASSLPLSDDSGVLSTHFAAQPAKCSEVVRTDLPGLRAAQSPKPDVSIPLQAEILGTLRQTAGIGNRVPAGHSIGTPIVMPLAPDMPEISDRRVHIAPTVNPRDRRASTVAVAVALQRGIPCFFAHLRLAAPIVNEPA